jgi:hypothetical protein
MKFEQALWRTRPDSWKVLRNAPKKTWIKQVEMDLAAYGISPDYANKNAAQDKKQWRKIVEFVWEGNFRSAPTVPYNLRPR